MKPVEKIFKIFSKPHPFIFERYSIIIPGIATFLIIVLFAPLQFQEIDLVKRSLFAFLISLFVSSAIFISVQSLKKFFPKFTHEDTWTVGKEIVLFLIVILVIIIGIFLAISFYFGFASIAQNFLKTSLLTLFIGLFPIILLILFEQYKYQKKQLIEASHLTHRLSTENHKLRMKSSYKSAENRQLQFKAENGNIELQVTPKELLCLRSDSNYVEVFYLQDEKCAKKLIRNRLKNFEEDLPKNRFFRCHNSYIVNGEHIVKVEGNARNLELLLRGIEFKVPVSRSKVKAMTLFLESLA